MAQEPLLEELIHTKGPVVSVTTDTPVADAVKLLRSKRILSVPVFDEDLAKYIGFIEELDIVSFAVVVAHSAILKEETKSWRLRQKFSWFSQEELQRLQFDSGTVGEILQLPGDKRRKMYVFQANAKLVNAMKILSKHHRVLVEHTARGFFSGFFPTVTTKLCSQTDVLHYIISHLNHPCFDWNDRFSIKLCDTDFFNKSFISIKVEDRAIDGFLEMLDNNCVVCGVTDGAGKLVASLTASCLRSITNDNLKQILLTVPEFLNAIHPESPLALPICKKDETISGIIRKILQLQVHECWVVDENNKPQSLITMGNIIRFALKGKK